MSMTSAMPWYGPVCHSPPVDPQLRQQLSEAHQKVLKLELMLPDDNGEFGRLRRELDELEQVGAGGARWPPNCTVPTCAVGGLGSAALGSYCMQAGSLVPARYMGPWI